MRVLHPREVQQLFQAVNRRAPFGERDHAMLALALHTGLRVSELVGLDVQATPHTLRHYSKRLSTVEIYTHPTREELEAAVTLLA